MNETGILATLVGLFCSALSSGFTFFLTKRKYNTEVDSQLIKNMRDSFDVHKQMMDEIFKTQNKKLEMLEKENNDLRQQVSQLQMQMINILGSICLDTTCKIRKTSFITEAVEGNKTIINELKEEMP